MKQQYYIDTNAILRFILKDNLSQYEKTKNLLEKAKNNQAYIILLNEVLVELSYVLIKVYQLEKSECVEILQTLVESEYINLVYDENKNTVIYALRIYLTNNIDIVDAILYSYSKINNAEVFSFDKDFNKISLK